MIKKREYNKKNYGYKYVQFTITSQEKQKIKLFALKRGFKTISEFMRRTIFDSIRREENPDVFYSSDTKSINPFQIQIIAQNISKLLKNQEIIVQQENILGDMRNMIISIHRLIEQNSFSKEREAITVLLKSHKSLSIKQIKEETNLSEDLIFKIISDTNLFKITNSGRFALR